MLYCTDIYYDENAEKKLRERDQMIDTHWQIFSENGHGDRVNVVHFTQDNNVIYVDGN